MPLMALTSRLPTGLSPWGAVVGALAMVASFSPSLLPRTWPLQGIAAGVSAALVYGIVVLIAWVLRQAADAVELRVQITSAPARWVRVLGYAVVAGALLAYWSWALEGQRLTAELVGMTAPSWWHSLLALVVAVIVAALGIGLARLLRRATRVVARRVPEWAPPWAAVLAGAVVVTLASVWITNAVLISQVSQAIAERFYTINMQAPEGVVQPTLSGRSGSPSSLRAWDSLGAQGQVFVTGGPDAADITAVTGEPAREPIRVYAGLDESASLGDVADDVVDELHRTGAFERSVLVVYTTTGTGWVNEWAAQSVEYLTGGNSAIAAMQYSYLPSPLALIADRVRPPTAGRALFDRVYAEVQTLPAADQPRIMVAGESLGSFGGHGAFADADDMVDRVDGGVWVGTPNFTPLWRTITAERQRGSPEVAPVVDNGRHLRFATRPQDLAADIFGRPLGDWEEPRIAYLQHASDPISWWGENLLTSRPDWIREQAGTDVNPDLGWLPLVTFWQVTTDLALGNATAPGHGHLYHEEVVLAWAAVLGEPETNVEAITTAITAAIAP